MELKKLKVNYWVHKFFLVDSFLLNFPPETYMHCFSLPCHILPTSSSNYIWWSIRLSIISGIAAAICTAVVVAQCNVDDSTSISWDSVYKISPSWADMLIFMSFYLESCIWRDALSQWIRQRNSDDATFLSKVITGDESWIYGYDPETKQQSSQWKRPNSPRLKKARQVKSKVKSFSSFWRQADCSQYVLAGQTVNSAYYCDVLWRLRENMQRLRPKLWWQNNWLLHHDSAPSHFLFHQGIFDQKHDCRPPHTLLTWLDPYDFSHLNLYI
jgi:hypothetical protein